MKTDGNTIVNRLAKSRATLRKYGVRRLALFGSAVNGRRTRSSDLDFLVEFKRPSFDGYMDLKTYLERRFRRKVDLVPAESLKSRLRPIVARQAVNVPGL